MIREWLSGLIRRRGGRLLAAAFGVAIAVALLASLGSFLTASKATMTARASTGVAVDWQVAVRPNSSGGDAASVLAATKAQPGTNAALPVGFAATSGFSATTNGTTQTTGTGKVLGVPDGYQSTFPGSIRLLTGSLQGVLVAQQTAANLHVAPGDTVRISSAGAPATVKVAGVVDLPQIDSLFQQVGAPAQSQPVAPPDNVILLPSAQFDQAFGVLAKSRPDLVTQQIHVRRSHQLPADPAAAYLVSQTAAHNLEVTTSGVGVVGDNLGTVLGAAREDALYSQLLFLFLCAPGVALAAALTAAVAEAGAARRRDEQQLLRSRGSSTRKLFRLVLVEGGMIAVVGGIGGLLAAYLISRLAFGSAGFGASTAGSVAWGGASVLAGLAIVVLVIVLPARRDLVRARGARADAARPRWLSYGLDVLAIAVALGVFWAAGRNKYTLVLAPEGVPTLSVSYWAFLAPSLGWIGAGLLAWRLADLLLSRGPRLLVALMRPMSGNLAPTAVAMMSRRRRPLARAAVLVGLALSFAMSTSTFNATYQKQAEVDAQLTNGADVTVTESPGTIVTPAAGQAIAAVPGVHAVEPLQHRFAYVGTDLQDLYGINASTINRATTLQDPYFQGASSAEMMRRLAAAPDAVLVSAETVNDYQLAPGDLLRLRLQDSRTHAYTAVNFHYAGIVNEFPTAPKDSFIVANAAYIAQQTHNDAVGAFLVSTGGSNVSGVAGRIGQAVGTSAAVSTIDNARGSVGSSLTSVDLSRLTRLELAFALLIAAAAGGLVMGLGLTERRQSLAVATVIGGRRRQLRQITIGEPLFVGTAGLLAGGLIGWGMSYLLVKVLTGVFDPAPTGLTVPWGYLAVVAGCLLGAIGTSAIWVSGRSRRHAGEYLRER